MEFKEIQALFRRHRNIVVFAAFLLLAAGLDLILNPPERGRIEILSIPFLIAGILLLAILLWRVQYVEEPSPAEYTLAHRFLQKVTFKWRMLPYFPLIGIIIVSLDVAYNAFLSPTPSLQIHDMVTIMFAISMISYPFIPHRFDREKDFVFLFFLVLVFILVLPLLLLRIYQGDFERGVDSYSWTMLAPQLHAMLGLIGIPSTVGSDPWGTASPGLAFITSGGQQIWVIITTSCSGIYSFSIFASAFTAFILAEFKKIGWRVWVLLALGFLAAYFANLFRMTIIVITGYISNTPEESLNAMMIAHSNAGWLIFLGWISLFWLLMYRFLFPKKNVEKKDLQKPVAVCSLCNNYLSPTIPGIRCECGKLYHVSCAQENSHCPTCKKLISQAETGNL